ncbi:kinase-like domain-containing protein [Dichomitus squalens]|uniref:Kinase-like domain-containing protein n=1 Tax=Dichomitus squalens TaxID=114155 RepID=A0A4Q9NWQ8_9APHY|nr:kinase-like domain-containing protein [Dichomitus squalens]TBU54476.1 kinase-like domain-containing protein [Dichomitus squalens]
MFLSAFSPTVSELSLAPDDEGALVAGYTLGPIVGRGGFSIIRTASSTQGGTVAVKIVRHSDLDKQPDPALARKSLEREAQVWASLNHEHILPLFTVNHTPYADFFFTAYCPAGSLFDILKRDGRPALPQDDAGMMFRQVVRGLRYMHEVAGFVHGDLKLENVLVDEMGVCKIGDFGMARKIGETDDDDVEPDAGDGVTRTRTLSQAHPPSSAHIHRSLGRSATGKLPPHLSLRLRQGLPTRHRTSSPYPASGSPTPLPNRGFAPGSLPYAAPELLLSPSSTTPYAAHPAQDIWALGVMLFALLTGKLPFSDSFEPRLQMKILHGAFEMPQGIGRCAEQALRGCIERSVPNRWTVAMVDEVAWGIGWGSAADDVTPPPEQAMASRSPSRSPAKTRKDYAPVDDRERRRSTSRAARSANRSSSVVRSASRSKSRSPHEHPYHHPLLQTSNHPAHPTPTQPSLSSLSDAILRTSSSTSDGSSADSAVVIPPSPVAPTHSISERGRAPRPRLHADVSMSRSRSPNETLPATPRDTSLDAVRRRKASASGPTISNPELGIEESLPELDTVDEDVRWPISPDVDVDADSDREPRSRARLRFRHDAHSSPASGSGSGSASRSRGRAFSRSRDELRKVLRNESMPPALSPTRPSAWVRAPVMATAMTMGKEKGFYGQGCATGVAASATPIAIPGGAKSARSKSLGAATGGRQWAV